MVDPSIAPVRTPGGTPEATHSEQWRNGGMQALSRGQPKILQYATYRREPHRTGYSGDERYRGKCAARRQAMKDTGDKAQTGRVGRIQRQVRRFSWICRECRLRRAISWLGPSRGFQDGRYREWHWKSVRRAAERFLVRVGKRGRYAAAVAALHMEGRQCVRDAGGDYRAVLNLSADMLAPVE
jgi:hypothetical protein